MTTPEKHLAQNLHRELGVRNTVLLGHRIVAQYVAPNMIVLADKDTESMIILSPEAFEALERFAEQIGWRPQ